MYNWNYTLTGNPALPPLILLHGWMGSGVDFNPVIELLRSRFYCIAIDLPGHGKTEVTGSDPGYDFVNTADGIVRLLASLHIDCCTIAGYSFGGRLALYLALTFPDRFNSVILESTSPGLATSSERTHRISNDDRIIDRLETIDFPTFINDWYRQPLFFGITEHPDFPILIERRLRNRPTNLAKSLQYAGLGRQPYLGGRFQTFDLPILLIVGEHDAKFLAIAQNITQTCPSSRIDIISNCSHNVHFQQPQLWVAAI